MVRIYEESEFGLVLLVHNIWILGVVWSKQKKKKDLTFDNWPALVVLNYF